MTARFHTRGTDPLTTAPQTQWQAQRMRGPILPMDQPRRRWWSRLWRAGR
jgi:hypothetical protein